MQKKTQKATTRRSALSIKEALAWLERRGSKKNIDGLKRYAIVAHRPFGVGVGELRKYAKLIGVDRALAQKLWASARYEARMLATFVDDPARVTARQMRAWAKEFDNWAIVDTACFALFDRTPQRWAQVPHWARAAAEFEKRAAFALIWSLSVHDRDAPDSAFLKCLPLIEKAATDERNFVKKAVDMALRAIGKRNAALNAAAMRTAERLAGLKNPTARWIGGHSLRELRSAAVQKRLQ